MPKIDLAKVAVKTGTSYPAPLAGIVRGRAAQALGAAGGLTQYGVNLVRLAPGAASAHRHWHEAEDEFVWMVEGELVERVATLAMMRKPSVDFSGYSQRHKWQIA
jgi:uncharacterized cupin superfamily protein